MDFNLINKVEEIRKENFELIKLLREKMGKQSQRKSETNTQFVKSHKQFSGTPPKSPKHKSTHDGQKRLTLHSPTLRKLKKSKVVTIVPEHFDQLSEVRQATPCHSNLMSSKQSARIKLFSPSKIKVRWDEIQIIF